MVKLINGQITFIVRDIFIVFEVFFFIDKLLWIHYFLSRTRFFNVSNRLFQILYFITFVLSNTCGDTLGAEFKDQQQTRPRGLSTGFRDSRASLAMVGKTSR